MIVIVLALKKAENLSDRWPMVACWVQFIFFKGVEGFLENQTGLWMEAFLDRPREVGHRLSTYHKLH